MDVVDVITNERARIIANVHSRKRALQQLAALLADGTPYLTVGDVFGALIRREKLGSTGIGNGVAIPHARLPGLDEGVGAVIRLSSAIDFDADDGQPVDLIFGLVVPQQSDPGYTRILHTLTHAFADADYRAELRRANDGNALVKALINHGAMAHAG